MNLRSKPKMQLAPEPKVPEVDKSDLSDVSASPSNLPADPEQEAAPSPPLVKKGHGKKGAAKGTAKGAGMGEAAKGAAGAQGTKRGRKAAGPVNGDVGEGGGAGKKTTTKGKAAKAPTVPTCCSPRN
ncbi:hypothetical protein FRC06_010000 [Ceratobasidium sp. 370]|nr:hypothetical protein FRC06_010000 [Ceratobasidium sp. 370]